MLSHITQHIECIFIIIIITSSQRIQNLAATQQVALDWAVKCIEYSHWLRNAHPETRRFDGGKHDADDFVLVMPMQNLTGREISGRANTEMAI